MNRFEKLAPLALALALLATPAPAVSLAAPSAAQSPAVHGAIDGGAAVETWMGSLASVACGLFTRATIATGGAVVGTWVGAVASCGFMLFDALFIDQN